jgi:hypothetical protein
MKKFLLLLLLTNSIITSALAYNAMKPWWVNLGIGGVNGNNTTDNCTRIYSWGIVDSCRNMNSMPIFGGSNFLLSYNYKTRENQLFSANYVQSNYSEFLGGLFGTPTDKGYINAISVEYGLIQQWRYGHIAGTIGPAFVSNRGAYNDQEWFPPPQHSGIGLSGKLEAAITPFRYFGLALSLVGNYNANMPYYGVFLSLQFGRFW